MFEKKLFAFVPFIRAITLAYVKVHAVFICVDVLLFDRSPVCVNDRIRVSICYQIFYYVYVLLFGGLLCLLN